MSDDTEFRAKVNQINSKKKLEITRKIADRIAPNDPHYEEFVMQVIDTLTDMESELRLVAHNAPHVSMEPTADLFPLYWMNAVAEQKLIRKMMGNKKRTLKVVTDRGLN